MKDDVSRSTFRKNKHYRKVRMQQGRVQVDADWNEQADIQAYYDATTLRDIIGKSGTSSENDGFRITIHKNTYQIGEGRYYVNGWLAENPRDVDGRDQIPHPSGNHDSVPNKMSDGRYLAYLDVWERHITALDDPHILESALGGADTTTRSKIEWQVRLQRIDEDYLEKKKSLLAQLPGTTEGILSSIYDLLRPAQSGTLCARSKRPETDMTSKDEFCMLPPKAGYRSLQNRLYRVEIHKAGKAGDGGATFKFSKDNASLVANITKIQSGKLYIESVGKDIIDDFKGHWVEITDDRYDLWAEPGTLVNIKEGTGENSVLEYDRKSIIGNSIEDSDSPRYHPKIRRWDSKVGKKFDVNVPSNNDGYIHLEDGIEIKFSETGYYKTGDYWLIPARTNTGDVEWPTKKNVPVSLLPEGIEHNFAPLALLDYSSKKNDFESSVDLRSIFPNISDILTLQYVGGDAQKAGPRRILHSPITVGVTRGKKPLAGIKVQFKVTEGNGSLFTKKPDREYPIGNRIESQEILTNENGIARCYWQLDHLKPHQQVKASMIDVDGEQIHLPILFNAQIDFNESPVGLKVHSGLISEEISAETYKIIGPIYHDIEKSTSSAPPVIMLGETNVEPVDVYIKERVMQIGDFNLLSLLNKEYGITLADPANTLDLPKESELRDLLTNKNSERTPIFFKPIQIDKEKFYVLLVNHRKKSSKYFWSECKSHNKKVQDMVIGTNPDGRLEIFAIGSDDGFFWHNLQTVAGLDAWEGWSQISFPGTTQKIKQIAETNNKDGRLEIFAITDDSVLWHKSKNIDNTWSEWVEVKGTFKQIEVDKNDDGSIAVLGIGKDDDLPYCIQQKTPNGIWGELESLPKLEIKQIKVDKNANGHLEVFAVPLKPIITHEHTHPTLSDSFREISESPFPIGPSNIGPIDPTSPIQFNYTETTSLYHVSQIEPNKNSWTDWNTFDGINVKQVTVGKNKTDNRLEVYAISEDDAVWSIRQYGPNADWSPWSPLLSPNPKTKQIALTHNEHGYLEVFVIIGDDVWHTRQTLSDHMLYGRSNLIGTSPELASNLPHIDRSIKYPKFNKSSWSQLAFSNLKTKQIAVTTNEDGLFVVFATDNLDNLWDIFQKKTQTDVRLRWWAIPSVDIPTNFVKPRVSISEKEEKEKQPTKPRAGETSTKPRAGVLPPKSGAGETSTKPRAGVLPPKSGAGETSTKPKDDEISTKPKDDKRTKKPKRRQKNKKTKSWRDRILFKSD